MKTILHVTEALGGGVTSALTQIIRLSPQHKHCVLAALRESDAVQTDWQTLGIDHWQLPRGLRAATTTIRTAYQKIRPDFVHLHSSFAGAWGRLSGGIPRQKIIYTPHCYAFERRDIGPLERLTFRLAEEILAVGGGTVAACSPREAQLARGLLAKQHVAVVPNSVRNDFLQPRGPHGMGRPFKVMMIGRAAAQKDPSFFAATARLLRAEKAPVEFHWLGDGPARPLLEAAGVKMSGWLPQLGLWTQLKTADLYFHCAAWEGCPMSLLEAAALDIPILGRSIPSLEALPLHHTVASPAAAARSIHHLLQSNELYPLRANAALIRERYSPEVEAKALEALYGS